VLGGAALWRFGLAQGRAGSTAGQSSAAGAGPGPDAWVGEMRLRRGRRLRGSFDDEVELAELE
jgi:hypothetical protein